MRKYAYLKDPLNYDGTGSVYKIMLYETSEGFYLFEYDRPDAVLCSADRCYPSLQDLYDDWNDLIDENGWIEIADPLPGYQHDAFLPVRVKGRKHGKPEWGKYEVLQDGRWVAFRAGDHRTCGSER